MELVPGQESVIGVGRMGEVRLAKDKKDSNHYVILKYIIRTDENLPRRLLSFMEQEVTVLQSIQHEFLLPVRDIIEDPFRRCVVMDYAPYRSISEVMERVPLEIFPLTLYFRWIHQVTMAFEFLHSHNRPFIHGGLHIRNVLISADFTVKVSDYGLRNWMDAVIKSGIKYQMDYVHSAPEVISSGRFSKASDVYSFGIFLFELFVGCKAYGDISLRQLYNKIKQGARPNLDRLPKWLPEFIRSQMPKCWNSKIEERPTFSGLNKEYENKVGKAHRSVLDRDNEFLRKNLNATMRPQPDKARCQDTVGSSHVPLNNNHPPSTVSLSCASTFRQTGSSSLGLSQVGLTNDTVRTENFDTRSTELSRHNGELQLDGHGEEEAKRPVQVSDKTRHGLPRPTEPVQHQHGSSKAYRQTQASVAGVPNLGGLTQGLSGLRIPGNTQYSRQTAPSKIVGRNITVGADGTVGGITVGDGRHHGAVGGIHRSPGRGSQTPVVNENVTAPFPGTVIEHENAYGDKTKVTINAPTPHLKVGCTFVGGATESGGDNHQTPSELCTGPVSVSMRRIIHGDMDIVASNGSKDWKRIGRSLDLTPGQLDTIECDYPTNSYERTYQMVYKWRNGQGNNATLAALVKALNGSGCGFIGNKLKINYN